MLDYSRYFEAAQVEKALSALCASISGLRVLDFGCLVSDYGLYFARRGASIAIYDHDVAVNFAAFRYGREKFRPAIYLVPTEYEVLFRERDLVVFGEVLEHLDDTLAIAKAVTENGVRYVFTSCYPYGSDQYFSMRGHSRLAQQQQGEFIQMMEVHYSTTITHKAARFWKRRS